ncbi:acetyl/propionyl/methylcrotonyl-CoA carboxylase subunit alpha [Mycobacterium stomatepiae]|uniref:biotin carboxylase n=1 Tax=Mycobacterium stomatepiae TaxID=470076 RepID=A0A7I7QET6_9MYCO|nr:biotin carboxylase N-terminal domain-containing protein [Mycobacterium stomatepiae]MCV7167170.1 acetyl/propionyl-CoA carboxylase subunit alpha [Mycobacterium stomatepiae]BBY24769.1 acetyl/propionyl-CoA carboxylase subuit alpha [Mycobacterium stomatepiae]
MGITRVLVANRGEIARRVFASCRRLGLGTVAVYTEPDAAAPHVAEADAAVRLAKTNDYLNAEAIIAAARAAGADAVHPGYGFLSENAEFAAAVQAAGLTWVGPPVDAVRAMGSKIESKKLMASAGVPVLDELDPDSITQAQLPVLVKASAGGGGRGMRVVHELSALAGEVAAAQREAQSAFGDPTVFCERYLPTGHHVEVQVLADTHGTVWAVGERECSIQRRHQKIIEEAPSPLVERIPGMRAKLFDAARLAASAIGYAGAGTVEFLADPNSQDGEFFFLEMNTRLQVEHPVTEETAGLDLVELQLAVADGDRLDVEPPVAHGHSIEARLYAEGPARGWQPQAGPVHTFDVPGTRAQFDSLRQRTGIRLDSGIVDGSVVSIHYDPMLAKVISYAPTRRQSALVLADALARTRLHGLRTNRELLVNVLRHPAFLDGATDTAFFDTHGLAQLSAPLADAAVVRLSAIAAALAEAAHNRASAAVYGSLPSGWRNLTSGYQVKSYTDDEDNEHRVEYRFTRTGLVLAGDEPVQLVSSAPGEVVLADANGVACRFTVARHGRDVYVDSTRGPVHLDAVPRFPEPGSAVAKGSLVAPMPGNVIRLGAQVGERVTTGQPLIWLEAMKMEHTISAPSDGVLAELNVTTGQQVEVGAVLGVIASAAQPGAAGHDHPDTARVDAPEAEGDS